MIGLGLSLPSVSTRRGNAPTLDLDFLSGASLDSRITFTRASTATYFDHAGVLQTATTNAPRLDYDPATLTARGLLVEESRTNSLRNNAMAGGVAGSPGTVPTGWSLFSGTGLTREIAFGTEFGMPYIQIRLFGTASGAIAGVLAGMVGSGEIAAASGQTWTGSVYVRQTAGAFRALNLTITERDAGGALLASTGPTFTPTASYGRSTATRTFNNASTALATLEMRFNATNGEAIDMTYRIALPQVEQGAFATSPIMTTGAAATRAADLATMTTIAPWFNAAEGTVLVEDDLPNQTRNPNIAVGFGFSDTTFNNSLYMSHGTSTDTVSVIVGGVQQAAVSAGAAMDGPRKVAFVYRLNDFATVRNGGAVGTDTLGTVPSLTQARIGSASWGSGGNQINGHVRRVRYWPTRFPDATLQGITA